MSTIEENQAISNARAWMEEIIEMVKALDADEDGQIDEARERILESALSVEVRSGWHVPGQQSECGEYMILLTTGGPALRIIGDIEYEQAENARLEWQDWGTPWTPHRLSPDEAAAVLTFAQQFYLAEG